MNEKDSESSSSLLSSLVAKADSERLIFSTSQVLGHRACAAMVALPHSTLALFLKIYYVWQEAVYLFGCNNLVVFIFIFVY